MDTFWTNTNINEFLRFIPPLKEKLYSRVADIVRKHGGKRVVDYGCGEGNQISFLPSNLEVGLYDINQAAAQIALNTHSDRNVYIVDNITEKYHGFFDVIIANMVWMCLKDENEFDEFFKNLNLLKSDKGLIILSMTHPCFRDREFSYYDTEYSCMKKSFDYFSEGDDFRVYVRNKANSQFTDYHHSLSFFFRKIREKGFSVLDFIEIPDEEYDRRVNGMFSPYLITVLK